MPPKHFGQVQAQLVQLFSRPPKLSFDNQAVRVEYKFPDLYRPERLYRAYDQRMMEARDASVIYERLAPALKEIFVSLHKGTRKFEYARTPSSQWNEYLRFSCDELEIHGPRKFRISSSASRVWTPARSINENRSVASHWFMKELIPSLVDNPKQFRHFVVGDPGSGKSTFIKYLINVHWRDLKEMQVVMSRFEFMKFMSRWYRKGEHVSHSLDDYISYILLRDLITQKFFSLPGGDRFEPNLIVQTPRLLDEISKEVDAAFENSLDPEIKRVTKANLVHHLVDIVSSPQYEPKRLQDIPPVVRIALIAHFLRHSRAIVVLDGLDHVSIQDTVAASDRQIVLDFVLTNLGTIATFRSYYPNGFGQPVEVLCIIRESTVGINQGSKGRLDVDLGRDKIYRVGEIEPRLATFNAIRRSLGEWAQQEPGRSREANRISHLLMSAIDATMRIITRSVGSRQNFESTYQIFGGNLRTLFDFMRKLLTWFVEESIRDGWLTVSLETSAQSILAAMVGPEGLQMLRRRKYRVVEILLFSEMPWFENAVTVEQTDQLLNLLRGAASNDTQSTFENKFFTGVIDNIFNYHIRLHDNNSDLHCLLEKVRVVQILADNPRPYAELSKALAGRIGYRSTSILDTVVLLIRNESVKFSYTQASGLRLFATARGQFVVQYLCREMSYLEHVFHRTLFPRQVVENLKDERRDSGVENWTVASIRNCFIFLTYLNFVESNKAGGRAVPVSLRLFEPISRRLVATLERILRGQESRSLETTVGYRALQAIERQIEEWNRHSILVDKVPT